MATEKAKKVKESTSVPKKVSAEKDVTKRSAVKIEEEKTLVSEAKPKKATVQKEEKLAQPIDVSAAAKKPRTKKTTAESLPAQVITEPVTKVETVKVKPVKASKPATKKDEVSATQETAITNVTPEVSTAATTVTEPDAEVTSTRNLKVTFQLKYTTRFGQRLVISGNNNTLGNEDLNIAYPMQYFNDEFWYAEVDFADEALTTDINYNYYLVSEDGSIVKDGANDRVLSLPSTNASDVLLVDTWIEASFENKLYSEPSTTNVVSEVALTENATHIFRVKTPALPEDYTLFIAGNIEELGSWKDDGIKLLSRTGTNVWSIDLDLSNTVFPVIYKYGIYNVAEKKIVEFEVGDNKVFYGSVGTKDLTIISDGFAALDTEVLKMAV